MEILSICMNNIGNNLTQTRYKLCCRIGLLSQQLGTPKKSSMANLEKGINKNGILVTCYHQGINIPLSSPKEYVLFFICII